MSKPETARGGEPEPLIRVQGLSCHFDVSRRWLNRALEGRPRQWLKAVDGIEFSINRGETFALVGESGCGKSTVARVIVGLYRASSGRIEFDGVILDDSNSIKRPAAIRRRMQMIFQDPYASLNPRWRISRIIAEPMRAQELRRSEREIKLRIAELLSMVGLAPADADKYPHEFSGGQRQRISIARALSSNPEFLVCDEPTSALDVSVQAQILNLMRDLQRKMHLTYLFISHNLAVVSHMSNRVGVMYLGRLVEVADARTLFAKPQHPYTRMLIDALPHLTAVGRARTPVAGEVPNPMSPPPGCSFHPRCPFANSRCRSETPLHITAPSGATVACHAVEEGRI